MDKKNAVSSGFDKNGTAASCRYDPAEFSTLLRSMKGIMSAREFALHTGLSESFISKAVNGLQKNRPSKRTVLKLLVSDSGKTVDRERLIAATGYDAADFDGDADAGSAVWQRFSSARLLTGVYGEDPFVAMCEFLRALTERGLNGDVTCRFYHRFGYFEVTDSITGQVYAGINAYLKPCDDKDGCGGSPDAELRSAIAVAFSAGQLFSHITKSDGAKEKIVYILADNERIYNALCSNLLKSETKATVVLFTDDHCGFSREAVLNGEENAPISLVD